MPNYAVQLAYDGTSFVGWQSQINGPCVQDAVKSALDRLEQGEHKVIGAGRTDSGVHARGQVANVHMFREWEARRLLLALDAKLPDSVSAMRMVRVADDFHARYDAKSREYVYAIWNASVCYPHIKPYVHWLPGAFDWSLAAEACRLFEGQHDFRAFARRNPPPGNSVRVLSRIRLRQRGKLILLRVRANGFLTHMVRIMVGTLCEIARGAKPIAWIEELLNHPQGNAPAGRKSPASGLHLWRVEYDLPLWGSQKIPEKGFSLV